LLWSHRWLGGIVIGYTNNPLIYQGDAMVHVAVAKSTEPAS
jgi:hypothetical protein